jgi:3',5'-cyclic-AMP phosphodiesterase
MLNDALLRFVHISDTHISPDPDYTYNDGNIPLSMPGAQALVQQVNALPFTPDFVLHTGDIAYDPDTAAYHMARAILGQIKFPIYYLTGNHDDASALQRIMLDKPNPKAPFHYEFEVNGVQIICLDTQSAVKQQGIKEPAGWLDDGQLAWLEALCAAHDERPLVVALHHNPLKVGIPWFDDYMALQNGEALHARLLKARERLRGVFFGHIHQNVDLYRDGILYSSVLSSWYQLHSYPDQVKTNVDVAAEPGFNVVTVARDQTFIRRHRFSVQG